MVFLDGVGLFLKQLQRLSTRRMARGCWVVKTSEQKMFIAGSVESVKGLGFGEASGLS